VSYARRDATSDVHVINAGERVECCNCSLGPDFAGTREEMLAHLEAHVAAGHKVPGYCTERLSYEARTGTTGTESIDALFRGTTVKPTWGGG
jgi:hypothetical protein